MVVTPLAAGRLDVALPESGRGGGDGKVRALVVEVRGEQLTLNGAPVADLAALVDRVGAALSAAPETPAFVRGEGVSYGTVVRVLDALEGAGVRRIGMVSRR